MVIELVEDVDMRKVPIQIKNLEVRNVPSAGLQVFAHIDQEVPCVEFTMKRDHFQPIMYRPNAPVMVYSEPFVQFAPEQWDQMLNKLFTEMVELWNHKYGAGSERIEIDGDQRCAECGSTEAGNCFYCKMD